MLIMTESAGLLLSDVRPRSYGAVLGVSGRQLWEVDIGWRMT